MPKDEPFADAEIRTMMRPTRLIAATLLIPALAACSRNPEEVIDSWDASDVPVVSQRSWPVPETILLVMIDTLRADVVGAYGSTRGLTPNLDEFAERAAVFENAYGTASWTRPSVASMLTGRYPTSHTAVSKFDTLPEEALLLTEVLESTRSTWSFGITTNAIISPNFGFGQGYDRYGPVEGAERRRYPDDKIGLVPGVAVSEKTISLLADERRAAAESTFAFVQYIDPHVPYYPNPGFIKEPMPDGAYSGSRHDIQRMVADGENAWTKRNIARLRYLYDGEVAYADHAFGELMGGLKQLGLYDGALIVVVSDHGEAFWEHGMQGHGKTLYEEEIRVPLMIKLPGAESGSMLRIGQAVSILDITPTILDAVMLIPAAEIEGRSLLPLISGEFRNGRLAYVFAELHFMENNSVAMVRHGAMKLVATYLQDQNTTLLELFNLDMDPGETNNLISDDGFERQRNELVGALSAWESYVQDRALTRHRTELSEMDGTSINELKGLGYIQ